MTGGGTDPNSGPLLALLGARLLARPGPPVPAPVPHRRRPGWRTDGRVMIPAWLLDIFAAVMLGVVALDRDPPGRGAAVAAGGATGGAGRRRRRAPADGPRDGGRCCTPSLTTLPDDAWAVIFGVLTAWFASRVVPRRPGQRRLGALSGGHCAPHLIHATAMMYMFLPLQPGVLESPLLAFAFALVLIGYSIWDLDQLSGPGPSGHYSLATARVREGAGHRRARRPSRCRCPPGRAAASCWAPPPRGPAARAWPRPAGVPPACVCAPGGGTGVLRPWVTIGCRITMGVTMAFMLLIVI